VQDKKKGNIKYSANSVTLWAFINSKRKKKTTTITRAVRVEGKSECRLMVKSESLMPKVRR
jgi:hypothetical protein